MTDYNINKNLLLEEWKEARNSIARFDEHLVNLRKYGFTLATLLLTVDVYLTMAGALKEQPLAILATTAVVIVLIFALFLIDQHIRALQLATIDRAIQIEGKSKLKELKLTTSLKKVSKKWQTTHGGTPVYVLFVLVTGFLGIVALYQYQVAQLSLAEGTQQTLSVWKEAWKMAQMKFMVGLSSFFCILIPLYGWGVRTAAELPKDVRQAPKRIRGVPQYTSRTVKRILKVSMKSEEKPK